MAMSPQEINDNAQVLMKALRGLGFTSGGGGGSGGSGGGGGTGGGGGGGSGSTRQEAKNIDYQRTLTQSLIEAANETNKFIDRFANLSRVTENVSNKVLDSMMNNLSKFATGFSSGVSNVDAALKSQAATYKNPKQFMNFLSGLGAALDDVSEDLKAASAASFSEIAASLTGKVQKTNKAYQTVIDNAKNFGDKLGVESKATIEKMKAGEEVTARSIKRLSAELDTAIPAIRQFATEGSRSAVGIAAAGRNRQNIEDKMSSMLGIKNLEFGAFLGLFIAGLTKAFSDYRNVASAGLLGRFGEITVAGAKLGVSVEKLTGIYRDNARGLAMGMGDSFFKTLEAGQDGLMNLGLRAEEAAIGANGFYKNAIASGLNPRDTNKLNASIKFQTDAFRDLRSITGATIEEFNSMNEGLATNADNMAMSLRFAPQERAAKMQELISLRNEFTQRGLSAKAADTMVQAMQGFSKNKLKDRLEAAARMQQAAGIVGMGGEGTEAAGLMRKRNLSGDEKARLADLTAGITGAMAQFGNAGMAQENLMDVVDEGMGGAAKGLMEASVQLKAAADAMMGVTNAEVGAEGKRNTAAKGEAAGFKLLDITLNAINSSLGKILIAMGGMALLSTLGGAKGIGSLISSLLPSFVRGFGSGIMGMFSSLGGGIMGVFRGILPLIGGLAKFAGPIGIVVALVTAGIELFQKFGDVLKFDSFGELLKSIGGLLLQAGSEIIQLLMRIPEFLMDALSWLLGSFAPDWLKDASKSIGKAREAVGDFFDGITSSVLGWWRTDDEKEKIKQNDAKIKSEKAAAAAAKSGTKAIDDKTAATIKEKSATELIGATSSPITADSLRAEAIAATAVKKEEPGVTATTATAAAATAAAITAKPLDVKIVNTEPILVSLDKSSIILSALNNTPNIADIALEFAKATPMGMMVTASTEVFEKLKDFVGINTNPIDASMDKPIIPGDINNKPNVNMSQENMIDALGPLASNTSGKKITLEDIHKKLEEILDATKEDTDKVASVLSRNRGSRFSNAPTGLLA